MKKRAAVGARRHARGWAGFIALALGHTYTIDYRPPGLAWIVAYSVKREEEGKVKVSACVKEKKSVRRIHTSHDHAIAVREVK